MTLPIVAMGLNRPLPIEVTAITQPFWDGLSQGSFLVVRCRSCERLSFPPRQICPKCHHREFDWLPMSGRCTLYSATKIHNSPSIYGILSPMQVGIVDLVEGVRIVTRLLPKGSSYQLDKPLQLVITKHPDGYHYAARSAAEV